MAYFTKGAFADDPWAAQDILGVTEWRERLQGGGPAPAVRLEPGFDVETLGGGIQQLKLIAIAFPKFTDGRGYSMGWLLRTRCGYRGEMRAVGDVLFDEMQFMVRCGFDSFEVNDPETIRLLQDGRRAAAFDCFYQPGLPQQGLAAEVPVGTRPWARGTASRHAGT
jgi:phosphoadenosine phosphosulfate reductase